MMSTLCEAWYLLRHNLGLPSDEVGTIFEDWNSSGSLKDTFLIKFGSEICQRKKTPKGDGHGEGVGQSGHVLDDVLDKVVQDDDDTEGTGVWHVMEAAMRHVSNPTNAEGHFFRVASGDRAQRLKVADKLQIPPPQEKVSVHDKDVFIEDLRQAVYASFLAAYCQGLELIARASKDEGWNVDLGMCEEIRLDIH